MEQPRTVAAHEVLGACCRPSSVARPSFRGPGNAGARSNPGDSSAHSKDSDCNRCTAAAADRRRPPQTATNKKWLHETNDGATAPPSQSPEWMALRIGAADCQPPVEITGIVTAAF